MTVNGMFSQAGDANCLDVAGWTQLRDALWCSDPKAVAHSLHAVQFNRLADALRAGGFTPMYGVPHSEAADRFLNRAAQGCLVLHSSGSLPVSNLPAGCFHSNQVPRELFAWSTCADVLFVFQAVLLQCLLPVRKRWRW